MRLPPPYHGDFRPDLLQDVDYFMHVHIPFYQKCNPIFLNISKGLTALE